MVRPGRIKDMEKRNIVLIGMPGVGKSTVGVVLAKSIGYGFLDSDLRIQEAYGKLLHELIAERGLSGFLAIENQVNAAIVEERYVIATGGSAVFGKEAMQHLAQTGIIIYLSASYASIAERLGDLRERGVVLEKNQTLAELYEQRKPLYEWYADHTIHCDSKSIRDIVGEIKAKVHGLM